MLKIVEKKFFICVWYLVYLRLLLGMILKQSTYRQNAQIFYENEYGFMHLTKIFLCNFTIFCVSFTFLVAWLRNHILQCSPFAPRNDRQCHYRLIYIMDKLFCKTVSEQLVLNDSFIVFFLKQLKRLKCFIDNVFDKWCIPL